MQPRGRRPDPGRREGDTVASGSGSSSPREARSGAAREQAGEQEAREQAREEGGGGEREALSHPNPNSSSDTMLSKDQYIQVTCVYGYAKKHPIQVISNTSRYKVFSNFPN